MVKTMLVSAMLVMAAMGVMAMAGCRQSGALDIAAQGAVRNPSGIQPATMADKPNPDKSNPTEFAHKTTLTLRQARLFADAAEQKATELNRSLSIVVMGADGYLLYAQRRESTSWETLAYAEGKARLSLLYRKPTQMVDAGTLTTRHVDGRMYVSGIGGGIPIIVNGQLVGALGVSGAPHEVDREIVLGALTTVSEKIPGIQLVFEPPAAKK